MGSVAGDRSDPLSVSNRGAAEETAGRFSARVGQDGSVSPGHFAASGLPAREPWTVLLDFLVGELVVRVVHGEPLDLLAVRAEHEDGGDGVDSNFSKPTPKSSLRRTFRKFAFLDRRKSLAASTAFASLVSSRERR
ncbi:MAG: hypothetical protein U0835_11670 [Isosphaeraceae bacterium]